MIPASKVNIDGSQVQTLVVGAGLSGILSALVRAKSGQEVLLVEASEQLGGRWALERREDFQFGIGFSFTDCGLWKEIAGILDIPLQYLPIENGNCILYNPRGWQKAVDLPPWEAYYARENTFVPKLGMAGIFTELRVLLEQQSNIKVLFNAPVTGIFIESDGTQTAVIGSNDRVAFSECIWASEVKSAIEVLSGDVVLSELLRVHLVKKRAQNQPGVILDFAHSQPVTNFTETLAIPFPIVEKQEKHFLMGAFVNNRDQGLCQKGKALSTWIFRLTAKESEDNHEIMKKIRLARRMLEKAFPEFSKSILFERVRILDHTISVQDESKKKDLDFFKIARDKNLLFVSDWASPYGSHTEGMIKNILDIFSSEIESLKKGTIPQSKKVNETRTSLV